MKKGVIMNIEREYLTMLTPEGEFIKTRNQNENYQLGDELVFFPLQEEHIARFSFKDRFSPLKLKWISALTALLLVISFIPTYLNEDVHAYMSIDINPSFEIGLDQQLQVLDIKAMNEEAKLIVQQIDKWKNQHVDTITETIIIKSRENGYLNEGQEIIITTVIEDDLGDEEEAKLEKDLETGLTVLSDSLEKEEDIVITAIKSDEVTREKAKKQGVSTGKLIQQEKKKQVEDETKNVNNENNSDVNNDDTKEMKNSEKQQMSEQKQQDKKQKENEKPKESEIKKENGNEKAIREKDSREQRNNIGNDKEKKERQRDKLESKQDRQEKKQDRQQDRKEGQQDRQENSGR